MQEKNIVSPENIKLFGNSLESIRTSLLSLLNIANDMIPEELYKDGLKSSISCICRSFQSEKKIKIKSSFQGDLIRLNEHTERLIFRIFTTLISFITSQANVSEVSASMKQSSETFSYLFTFNGKEFNLSNISSAEINEIATIKSLVESLNGNFHLYEFQEKLNKIKVEVKILDV
jgi:signal transduction histidine kinase